MFACGRGQLERGPTEDHNGPRDSSPPPAKRPSPVWARRPMSVPGVLGRLREVERESGRPPGSVRLVAVTPGAGGSTTELTLTAVGRSSQDALALLQSLQAHADFDGAFLNGWTDATEGVDISCTVHYVPKPVARP